MLSAAVVQKEGLFCQLTNIWDQLYKVFSECK